MIRVEPTPLTTSARALPPPDTFGVLGVPISVTSLGAASALIHLWAQDDRGRFVVVRDMHGVVLAHDHPALRAVHLRAAMVTPDGMPLVWIGKARGLPVERTCGPDLMLCVLQHSVDTGLKHYFYGGKPGVAEKLKAVLTQKFLGVAIVETAAPPFRDLTDEELAQEAQRIRESKADIVWVGISTPQQDFLMGRLAPLVSATLIGVGAAFDFNSGAVKRAPIWMQRSGLEWLHRLLSEPRRLWRRYLIDLPRFVFLLAAEWVSR